MSQPAVTGVSSEPSAFCALYSTLTLAKLSETWSIGDVAALGAAGLVAGHEHVGERPGQELLLPLAGLAADELGLLEVLAAGAREEQLRARLAHARDEVEVLDRTLPAPPPPPPCAGCARWVSPQDQESTSIQSLCLASVLSPAMPVICRK